MLESLCDKLGVFILGNIGFIVAVILAVKWLARKKLNPVSIAGMKHEPVESDLYLDTVAALRSLGVAKAVAKKRVEDTMQLNPNVNDPKELLKLCYQEKCDD